MTTELDRNIERLVNADHNTKNRSSVNGMNDRDSFDFFYGDTTIERLIVAYTRQQLGDIAYNAVTTLVDPVDLYLWRALPKAVTA